MEENPYKIQRTWFKWPSWFSRRRRRALLALVVLALFLWKYPRWAVQRAHDHYIACTNAIYDHAAGRPESCRQSLLLAIPRIVPWTRHDALQVASDIEYTVAEDRLKLAALRSLDAAARDHAGRDLVDALGASPAPHIDFTTSSRLNGLGAYSILIDRAADLHDAAGRKDALTEAVRLGDAAAFAKITALPPPRDPKYEPPLAAGIAQCIAGNRPAGVQLLNDTNRAFINETASSSTDAEFALAACNPAGADQLSVDDVWAPRLAFVAAACGGPLRGSRSSEYIDSESAPAALIRATHDDANAEDILAIISPRYKGLRAPPRPILSPWSLLATPTDWPSTPAWADESAARIADLAAALKPPPRSHADDDYTGPASNDAHEHPLAHLHYAQLLLELESAYGWTRRGQLDKARAAALSARTLAHGADIESGAPLLVIATLQLVGEWDASLAEIAGLEAADISPDFRAVLAIQRVLALAHAGKLSDAYAALDSVIKLEVDERTANQLVWLRAALALALDKPIDVTLPKPPAKVGVLAKPREVVAYWLAAATASPDAQALVRWKSYDDLISDDDAGVLPAVYFIVGRAAGHGDVEAWLDAATGRATDDAQVVAAARAEAARWRGDTAAAKRWDDRLAGMRALAKDDCTAYLLWMITQP